MSVPTLSLCRTCQDADPGLADKLAKVITDAGILVDLQQVDCMSGCDRPQTLAIRQSGKTAYLFGEITAADIANILTFLRLYAENPDGNLPDALPLGELRFKAIARIPANLTQRSQ